MHYFSGKGCSESLESMHYCIGILIFRDNNSERCFFNDVDLFLQRKKAFLVFVDHEFAQNKDSNAKQNSSEH